MSDSETDRGRSVADVQNEREEMADSGGLRTRVVAGAAVDPESNGPGQKADYPDPLLEARCPGCGSDVNVLERAGHVRSPHLTRGGIRYCEGSCSNFDCEYFEDSSLVFFYGLMGVEPVNEETDPHYRPPDDWIPASERSNEDLSPMLRGSQQGYGTERDEYVHGPEEEDDEGDQQ